MQFSVRGDALLAATGSNQAKLYDRDGVETCAPPPDIAQHPANLPSSVSCQFAKGDMYIRDLRHTEYFTPLLHPSIALT